MWLEGWTDRGADPWFWEEGLAYGYNRWHGISSINPNSRIFNFPYYSGGAGVRWDSAYDTSGWGGHPFHPIHSRSKFLYEKIDMLCHLKILL